MSKSEKYVYFWAIFTGIPFGIGCLAIASNYFTKIKSSVFDLERYDGKITSFEEKRIYEQQTKTHITEFFIKIENKEFLTEIGKKREILKRYIPNAYKENRNITIWVDMSSQNIEQLAIENKIIIPYFPPYWKGWTFLLIGLVFALMSIIYVIKYYKSTWGGK
jgi:hypothetical protein